MNDYGYISKEIGFLKLIKISERKIIIVKKGNK